MRFYCQPHRFYCGIDLHARCMYLCILDQDGNLVFDRNIPCDPKAFLHAIAPCRDGIVGGVECMFGWYWVADLCREQQIPFVLGHALYMKAIHGSKAKNDRIDAGKIARLLRGGTFPLSYVYPKGMRVPDLIALMGPRCGSAFLLCSRNAKSLYRGCRRVELTTNLDHSVERDPQVLTSRCGERVIF
jgi:hypothetical protein